jgi:hypothetical protein
LAGTRDRVREQDCRGSTKDVFILARTFYRLETVTQCPCPSVRNAKEMALKAWMCSRNEHGVKLGYDERLEAGVSIPTYDLRRPADNNLWYRSLLLVLTSVVNSRTL